MVQIELKNRGKRISKLPQSVDVGSVETVEGIKQLISRKTGLSVNRQRMTVPSVDGKSKDVVLTDETAVGDYFSTEDKIVINVKDLGPQIGWRTVFLLEYLGPLLIHPFFYYCQSFIYRQKFDHTLDQQLVYILCMLHFMKREYETAFVHHFSLSTMPLFNLFKNSSHYWVLSGVFLGFFCYAPPSWTSNLLFSRQFITLDQTTLYGLAGLWAFAEISNFICHLNLSSLRAGGSKERKIPYGYGFSLVSLPNYFFESLSWVAVCLISQNWSTWLFLAVSTGQMLIWAVKKHKRYRKDFPDYPKNRKAMIPFIL